MESYKLKTITKYDLQEFIINLYNKGFSINTISSIKGILTKSFGSAVEFNYKFKINGRSRLNINPD